ncbi:MAG: hypothetical protein JJE35_08910 [Thermoleophilia bacterium]|nr:hypothetical protein [Thermoleophilia bacterium]
MGRLRAILLAFVLAATAATTLSACGGSDSADLLPGETASEINANLDLVEQLVAEGDCVGAANAAAAIGEQVEGLSGVDKELKEALSEGATRLNEVIVECDEASEEEETTPAIEPEEELEEDEKGKDGKAEKDAEKDEKKEEKSEKEVPPVEPPEPPGQEKNEEEETPPTEPSDGGTSSGGVSPGAPAGAE